MHLLKFILLICISLNILINSSYAFANSKVYTTEDDWRYLMKEENIVMLNIDLDSSIQNQPTTHTKTSDNSNEDENINEKTQKIDLSLIKFDAKTPLVKGFAILVNDYAQPKKINTNLMYLAKSLPKYGYNTILVDYEQRLLDFYAHSTQTITENNSLVREREESSDFSENSENDTKLASAQVASQTGLKPNVFQAPLFEFSEQDYNQALALILTNLEQQYLDSSGYKIYISNGMSAFSLVRLLSEDSKLNADAIAISNPFWPDYKINRKISQSISKLNIPVLDLISVQDNMWSDSTSEYRQIAAKNAFLPFYRQKKLADGAFNMTQMEYEKKELISWLTYLGW